MAEKATAPSKLIGAIRSTQLEAVKAALAEGADIEEADIHGCKGLPLRTACFVGKLDIVNELLERGADPNPPGGDGTGAPLRLALRCNHIDIAALLLAKGALLPPGVTLPAGVLNSPEPSPRKPDPPPLEFDFPTKPSTAPEGRTVEQAFAATANSEADRDILLNSFEPEALGKAQEKESATTASVPVFPEGHVIEEVDVSACYGTDTNLLGLDLLKQAEESERANAPPPPPEPKSFWTTTRKKV